MSKSTGGIPIPLFVPNVLGYIRFLTILASWPFAMTDPQTFLALYATSYLLGAIDGPLAKLLNQQSFFGTQLDILMSRFATSSLIFAVLKLGLAVIKDEWERMKFAFFFATVFLSDFVSYWFQVYSSYLLDEESHVTPVKIVQTILWILKLPGIALAMNAMAELYVVDHYLAFFPNHPLQVKLVTCECYGMFVTAVKAGLALKVGHNVAHLLVSAVRIVKLDVNQKNAELKRQ
ncbi:hypothetical protein FGO68_gene2396 [Halteria grandinella]|uniref:Uncharacterized protein n=1 Tax=Halteria grandinella TaxID=5974 RepID=A0A8J8SW65_HALGN|nr:hypothetical protein FGO68_gene2396 [Halteria grandinella]